MFKFKEYVNASSIWPTAKDFVDLGKRDGLMRGYNVEIQKLDGTTGWCSCEYIYGSPEFEFDDDFHRYHFEEMGATLTGRICFRGYAREEWSYEIGEYVVPVTVEE